MTLLHYLQGIFGTDVYFDKTFVLFKLMKRGKTAFRMVADKFCQEFLQLLYSVVT